MRVKVGGVLFFARDRMLVGGRARGGMGFFFFSEQIASLVEGRDGEGEES